jgi:hypothetical protein
MAARRYGAVPKAVMIEPRKRSIAEDRCKHTLHRQAASPREGPKIRGPLEPTYVVWFFFFEAGPAQASPKLQSPRSLAPGSLAPWLLGSLAPWLLGSLAPWLLGSLAPRLLGSSAPRLLGSSAWLINQIPRSCSCTRALDVPNGSERLVRKRSAPGLVLCVPDLRRYAGG